MAQELVLKPAAVHEFASNMCQAIGIPENDADVIADSMVYNALHGRITHSLMRLDLIAQRVRAGSLSLTTDWTPVREQGVSTLLDAGHTWGVLAGTYGMRHAVAKAKQFGVGITNVRNCDNTGALSWYTSRAVEQDLIGIAASNTVPLLVLWGAAKKMIGNQPISFAVPAGKHPPIMIDQMHGMDRLNVPRDAAAAGQQLPPGVVVDADGAPTTDPNDYLNGGAMLPMGRHRGSSLTLMWEVLTGVLSGGQMLTHVTGTSTEERCANSLFLLAMDPGTILTYDDFIGRVEQLIDEIHAAKPAPGVDRVRVPGDEREALAARLARDGIPFPAEHVALLEPLAAELGVAWPT